MEKRKILCIILTAVLLSSLTACTTRYSSIPTREDVIKEVSYICPNENFTLVDTSRENSIPRKTTYTFETDRGLKFQAVSTIGEKGSMGGSIKDLERKIIINYRESIYDLYKDDIFALFPENDYQSEYGIGIKLTGPESIDDIADRICQAQEIYSAELAYNPLEWQEENSKFTFYIDYSNLHYASTSFQLTGQYDRQAIINELQAIVEKGDS